MLALLLKWWKRHPVGVLALPFMVIPWMVLVLSLGGLLLGWTA